MYYILKVLRGNTLRKCSMITKITWGKCRSLCSSKIFRLQPSAVAISTTAVPVSWTVLSSSFCWIAAANRKFVVVRILKMAQVFCGVTEYGLMIILFIVSNFWRIWSSLYSVHQRFSWIIFNTWYPKVKPGLKHCVFSPGNTIKTYMNINTMQPRSKHKQRLGNRGDNAPSSFEFIWMCWWMNVLQATATNPCALPKRTKLAPKQRFKSFYAWDEQRTAWLLWM